jgi:hypothetical protein
MRGLGWAQEDFPGCGPHQTADSSEPTLAGSPESLHRPNYSPHIAIIHSSPSHTFFLPQHFSSRPCTERNIECSYEIWFRTECLKTIKGFQYWIRDFCGYLLDDSRTCRSGPAAADNQRPDFSFATCDNQHAWNITYESDQGWIEFAESNRPSL